jgi:hypothetical protein
MSWQREGQKVQGVYLDQFPVSGIVKDSRVAYGGRVKHLVVLDEPIEVYGAIRDHVIFDETELDLA